MTESPTESSAPRHLFLVDGSGYIFRAYHSLPPMTRPDGLPVNAVYGFTAMLMKLLADLKAHHVAVLFDAGRRTFRNDIYPPYKAHRPDPPDDLIPQFAVIREAVRAFNIPCLEQEGVEADDLIATIARRAVADGARVTVVSSDKDLMQLVREGVDLFDPMKNRTIGPQEVMDKFGVPPAQVVDVQALAGDAVDNVPGVPGIGIKTAAQLIATYQDLETLLARADEIRQPKRRQALIDHADQARISRELVRLRDELEVTETLEDFRISPPDPLRARAFLTENGFRSLLARLEAVTPAASAAGGATGRDGGTGGTGGSPNGGTAADDYHLVTTLADLDAWIAEARKTGLVAVDTETDSLVARRARLVGISLATRPGRACYIPFVHTPDEGPEPGLDLTLDHPGEAGGAPTGPATRDDLSPGVIEHPGEALRRLGDLFADPGVLKVGQNIKYDLHVLAGVGVEPVTPIDDTMVLSYVLNGTRHGHGMDELADRYLGRTTIPFDAVCGKGKTARTFDRVPLAQALDYAAEDADVTLRLYLLFRERLLKERLVTVHETLDRPLVPILFAMERVGILVDALALKDLSGLFSRRMADLEADIHRLAGRPFNVASPKQLGEVLFEDMGLTGGRKSRKTGAWSTDAQVLDSLAAEGHDLPARVLDWRQLAKLKSTYTDALVADIDPGSGRVHTTYGLTVTSTGRLSSQDPNLQNIPIRTEEGRKIRAAFVAAPGHLLLSADYSQIELRLVAHVAAIAALRRAFANGQDIHAITAAQVFGVPVEGIDPGLRRRAKAINFGILYGISAHGLARQLGITRGEAQAFIDAYLARFPEILAYMEAVKATARERGHVETPFGRRIPIPGMTDKNPAQRAFAERQAINAPIQGGAADIIKRAMIRLPDRLAEAGLTGTTLLLQVHDELVFETREDEADTAAAVIRHTMETAVALTDAKGVTTVPLEVSVGRGRSWAEAH